MVSTVAIAHDVAATSVSETGSARFTEMLPPPTRTTEDPRGGVGRRVQHCDLLEQVPVGIAEVDRGRRHPADDARLVRLEAVEGQRRHAERAQSSRRSDDVLERDLERKVKRDAHRRRTVGPQADHRLPGAADPEKAAPICGSSQRKRQADDVAVEVDRTIEIAHGEMSLEQALDVGGGAHSSSAMWSASTSASAICGGAASSSPAR